MLLLLVVAGRLMCRGATHGPAGETPLVRALAASPAPQARTRSGCGGHCLLRLAGGGKFPLQRMMKLTLDKLPPEERARMFDQLHRKVPELDADDDK